MQHANAPSSREPDAAVGRTHVPDRLVWLLIWALIVAAAVVILTVGTMLVQQMASALSDLWFVAFLALAGWCGYLTYRVRQLSRPAPTGLGARESHP